MHYCWYVFLNRFSLYLALVLSSLITLYPYTKRFYQAPQFILGLTFNGGILLAFSAVTNTLPAIAWLLYGMAVLWTVAYDTLYGMVDRDDDRTLGLHSTALWFGKADRAIVLALHLIIITLLLCLGYFLQMNTWYYAGVCRL